MLMRIMQLGNSAAVPYSGGFNVAYIVDVGKSYLLIESPPSILNQLNIAGIGIDDIEWVFMSHHHGDHILGLPMLLLAGYAGRMGKVWKIICQRHIEEKIIALISAVFPELLEGYMDNVVFFHIPDDGIYSVELSSGGVLNTVMASHGVPCCSLRVSIEERSVVYSADTAYSDNIVSLAYNADLLIHEVFGISDEMEERHKAKHSSIEQTALVAKRSNCKKLLLTHLKSSSADYIKKFFDMASMEFDGEVIVSDNFKWIDV